MDEFDSLDHMSTRMKKQLKRIRGLVIFWVCGVILLMTCGCETLPEGTVIYSPGDPNALINGRDPFPSNR